MSLRPTPKSPLFQSWCTKSVHQRPGHLPLYRVIQQRLSPAHPEMQVVSSTDPDTDKELGIQLFWTPFSLTFSVSIRAFPTKPSSMIPLLIPIIPIRDRKIPSISNKPDPPEYAKFTEPRFLSQRLRCPCMSSRQNAFYLPQQMQQQEPITPLQIGLSWI